MNTPQRHINARAHCLALLADISLGLAIVLTVTVAGIIGTDLITAALCAP